MGIPVEYAHHEVGPSQHEIDMRYAPALEMADATITYRLVVKEIAAKNGVYATFMPKPLFGENGSGMHTHMSLFTEGRNRFFDSDRITLADRARLHRGLAPPARDLSACSTSGQFVQRLVPATSSRVRRLSQRTAPPSSGSRSTSRAPSRQRRRDPLPDPPCNPYLPRRSLHPRARGQDREGYSSMAD